MTRLLLIITVIGMFALTIMAAYDTYRSLQTPTSEATDDGAEESPLLEIYSAPRPE